MSIARVRVARYEKWCAAAKNLLERASADDLEPIAEEIIGIETASMKQSDFCGGREWRVAQMAGDCVATNEISAENVPSSENTWICEHMLEMD